MGNLFSKRNPKPHIKLYTCAHDGIVHDPIIAGAYATKEELYTACLRFLGLLPPIQPSSLETNVSVGPKGLWHLEHALSEANFVNTAEGCSQAGSTQAVIKLTPIKIRDGPGAIKRHEDLGRGSLISSSSAASEAENQNPLLKLTDSEATPDTASSIHNLPLYSFSNNSTTSNNITIPNPDGHSVLNVHNNLGARTTFAGPERVVVCEGPTPSLTASVLPIHNTTGVSQGSGASAPAVMLGTLDLPNIVPSLEEPGVTDLVMNFSTDKDISTVHAMPDMRASSSFGEFSKSNHANSCFGLSTFKSHPNLEPNTFEITSGNNSRGTPSHIILTETPGVSCGSSDPTMFARDISILEGFPVRIRALDYELAR